jgi:hypothetical protein
MAEEKFGENLMRMIAGELHVLSSLAVAREMFGKGYFSLGAGERAIVDQAVMTMVGANYQAITPPIPGCPNTSATHGFWSPSRSTQAGKDIGTFLASWPTQMTGFGANSRILEKRPFASNLPSISTAKEGNDTPVNGWNIGIP